MSDEMGIRTPTYRVPRSRGMDPATKRLALIASGLGGVLLAVVGAWSVMDQHGGGGGVPVVAPPTGPLRVKPANPGGMQMSEANTDLFGGGGGDGSADKLAPPPETPDPQALHPAAIPAPTAPPTTMPTTAPAMPAQTALPAAQIKALVAKPPAAVAPLVEAHLTVQLAALPTEAAAKDEWTLLQHRLGGLLQGRQPAIARVDVGGHTWWRVRTGGFTDAAAAKSFCDQVRAKGESCDIIRS